MANDNKKKIILIVGLVLVMIAVGMSLNSYSNSVKEDKVVQKKSAKKSKSQDTTKTADEKKDESKVKQEEKKEETSKADSSNKSNVSESKKDNTASTTNTSSNKNDTSSSTKSSNSSSNNSSTSKPSNNSGSNSNSSKPAEHTHNWVAQYKTVNVPEKGHNEQVLVQAAYDEQVPITEMREHTICTTCGADITGHAVEHLENSLNCQGYHSKYSEDVTGYKTVHHDVVYETRYIVDSPATTKQELTGYKCSSCGKTRNN